MSGEKMSPAETARLTYEILAENLQPDPFGVPADQLPPRRVPPMEFPITFWEVHYRQHNEGGDPERFTGGKHPVALTTHGEGGGCLRGIGTRMDVCEADRVAHDEYFRNRSHFLTMGYSTISDEEISADHIRWTGKSASPGYHGYIIATVEVIRGPVRPDDETVIELAKLLKAQPLRMPR